MRSSKYPYSRAVFVLGSLLFLLLLSACEFTGTATTNPVDGEVYELLHWVDADQAIDVVFIPDDGYGDMNDAGDRQAFVDDVSNMIDEGFYQNNGIARNLVYFNFWYMTSTGDVQPPGAGICPTVTWPSLTNAAFAEVIVLLHTNTLRDCAWGNKVTSEPTSYRTVVHEASHAGFGLPDEYCCDGGYWSIAPILYSSQAACTSDGANAVWQDCDSYMASNGTVWWRSEDSDCDIMACGGFTVSEYGPADWAIAGGVLDALGPGIVNAPIVFAPAGWDWP